MRGPPSGGASHDRVYSRSRDRSRGTILLTLAPRVGAWLGLVTLVGPFVVVLAGHHSGDERGRHCLAAPPPGVPSAPADRTPTPTQATLPDCGVWITGPTKAPHREPPRRPQPFPG